MGQSKLRMLENYGVFGGRGDVMIENYNTLLIP